MIVILKIPPFHLAARAVFFYRFSSFAAAVYHPGSRIKAPGRRSACSAGGAGRGADGSDMGVFLPPMLFGTLCRIGRKRSLRAAVRPIFQTDSILTRRERIVKSFLTASGISSGFFGGKEKGLLKNSMFLTVHQQCWSGFRHF